RVTRRPPARSTPRAAATPPLPPARSRSRAEASRVPSARSGRGDARRDRNDGLRGRRSDEPASLGHVLMGSARLRPAARPCGRQPGRSACRAPPCTRLRVVAATTGAAAMAILPPMSDPKGPAGPVGAPVREGEVATRTRPKLERPQRFKVLIFNDDYTPMEFVVSVLEQVFRKSPAEATQLMLTI